LTFNIEIHEETIKVPKNKDKPNPQETVDEKQYTIVGFSIAPIS